MKKATRPFLLWLLLMLCSLTHASTVTYVYTDPQGTPLAEADANGNITATFDYRPYGSQALGAAPAGPGYTGHVNDPDTGMVYMQARYYDPGTGRFLSVDPVEPSVGDPFNFSRYAYANNNPITNTDPDGRCPDKNGCNEAIPYSVFRNTFLGRVASNVLGNPAAVFSSTDTNPLNGEVLDKGQIQDAKLGIATNVLSAIIYPELLGAKPGISVIKSNIGNVGEEIGILRNAAMGKGNYGLGQATAEEANALGKSWVGTNFRVASDGKTLVSESGLRAYRPPSAKSSPYASTGIQANFERMEMVRGRPAPIGNGHMDITP